MKEYDESSDSESSEEEELHQAKFPDDSGDSDKELQVAFKTGLLKPGLYAPATKEKPAVNNVDGMLEKLEEIEQKNMDWLERLDITVHRKSRDDPILSEGLTAAEARSNAEERLFTVHNDFKREMMFLTQAKDAVLKAIPLLKKAGIPTVRPEDYFAEMAKKDDHMKKVREKLLSLQRRKEASEKYRTQLKLKKYGKKVQHAVELERKKKKKEILDSVKKYRKGQKDKIDFLEGNESGRGKKQGKSSQLQNLQGQRKKSRSFRDKKFGFGGKKRGMKSNTTKSTNQVQGFRSKKGKPNNNKRLGKGRRQKLKQRK